mmetsp:Transcript_38360/g.62355  ORF Transcript_38360/g.62355 Transcript_38360/m.62355 type:complete len:81 (+) Transcript_38360:811-1053(+)
MYPRETFDTMSFSRKKKSQGTILDVNNSEIDKRVSLRRERSLVRSSLVGPLVFVDDIVTRTQIHGLHIAAIIDNRIALAC